MGLALSQVTFEGEAPDFQLIADRIAATTGLAVNLEKHDPLNGYLQSAHISFVDMPALRISMYVYDSAAMKFQQAAALGEEWASVMPVEGQNELPGTQTVYLKGYMGQEPTLQLAAQLVLESLGGKSRHPLSDETRKRLERPAVIAEMRREQRKLGAWMLLVAVLSVLALPFLLLKELVSAPWEMRKLKRLVRQMETVMDERGAGPKRNR